MTDLAAELLSELEAQGACVRVKCGRLLVGPRGRVPPELVERLRTEKTRLLALLCELPAWCDPGLWRETGAGLVRIDLEPRNGELVEADWACPQCGRLAWWESADGGRHCLDCEAEPLDRGKRLAEKAARLRNRHRP